MRNIQTAKDAWVLVAKRVAISVVITVALTTTLLFFNFGSNPNAVIPLKTVALNEFVNGIIIAALLTGVLTYRSTTVMRELQVARTELLLISRTDQLTGLLNRRGFDEAVEVALAIAGDAEAPAAALMCDIDHFKRINDTFGHQFGDQVLVEIANALRAFGDEYGALVARHGGEEFGIVMTGVTGVQALRRADILRQSCAAVRIPNESGSTTSVTVSIGLAMTHERTTLSDIMRAADKALYTAKNRGRDRVVPAQVGVTIAA